jgi:hypothetical protein
MLKTLRLVIPGVLIVLGFLPIAYGSSGLGAIIQGNEKFLWILALGAGAAYYVLDLRGRFMRFAVWKINDQIISTLLQPFSQHPVIGPARDRLAAGRKVMNIFYYFVDNDKSLSERAKSVYLNGLLLSSLPDLRAVTLLFLFIYPISYFLTGNGYLWLFFLVALILHLIAIPMMDEITRRHMALGEEQTAFILQFKSNELENRLIEAARA